MSEPKVCTCGSQEMALFMANRNAFVCLQCDGVRPHRNEWKELAALEAINKLEEVGNEQSDL